MDTLHPGILPAVEFSGLAGLVRVSYDTIDKGLLCAFVERWHAETNSFHLPVGELNIILVIAMFCNFVMKDLVYNYF